MGRLFLSGLNVSFYWVSSAYFYLAYHLRFDPKIALTRKFLIDPNEKRDYESTFMPLTDSDIDEKNLVNF